MNTNLTVTTRQDFECTYLSTVTSAASGLCFNAHRYTVEVTVSGDPTFPDNDVLIPFDALNMIVQLAVPNMCYLTSGKLQADMDIATLFQKYGLLVRYVDCTVICAESLARIIGNAIQKQLVGQYPHVVVKSVKLRETASNYVTWRPPVPSVSYD